MPSSLLKASEPIPGYTLIERLGAGGFGEVWKAEAPGGLLKAVKLVYGQIADRHASQEVKALDRIKQVRHPFVLSIERVEVVNGQLVIVSELADRTLLDRFEEGRNGGATGIPRKELLRYMQDAAEALDFISANYRLQHLDIKPSNLFLVAGRLKVGDFGLVREVSTRTGVSTPGLSPAYASPESFLGDVSLYSDQYALAIVYQEMLTGVRPFRGRTPPQLIEQHLHGQPNLALLPEGDQPIILRSLSKDPKERFPSCGDLVQALMSAPADEPEEAPRGADGPIAPPLAAVPAGPFDVLRSIHDVGGGISAVSLGTLHTDHVADPDFGAISGASRFTVSQFLGAVPQPTFFIGVGGIGGRVLQQIRHLFGARVEGDPSSRSFGWLLLDTDRHALVEAAQASVPGHLQPEETLLMPLHRPEYYRPRLKQLVGWLGRHWVFRIPRSRCTEGIRPLGRLALIDNADHVFTRMRQALRQLEPAIRDQGAEPFRVVVVSSISGGTGGGCLVDIGFLLRRLLREEGLEQTPVEAMVVTGACISKEQNELARANSYVTLKELDHFHRAGSSFSVDDALGLAPAEGQTSGFPFQSVTLVDFDDIVGDEDVHAGARLLAEYAYLHRGTPYGRQGDHKAAGAAAEAQRPSIKSFRLARFGFPRAELVRIVAREVCHRMIGGWLTGTPPVDSSSTASSLIGVDSTITVLLPPSDEAGRLFSGMELDEEKFLELFLERAERVSGTDALKLCQHQIRDVLEARNRGAVDRALARFFAECDGLFGPPVHTEGDAVPVSPFERKVQGEFKYDAADKLHRLEARIRELVEHPARRLRPAEDVLNEFRARLAEQADAVPAMIQAVRDRKEEIRLRLLGEEARTRVVGFIKQFQRDAVPPAEELARYVALCVREIACRSRVELLRALRGKAAMLAEELARLRKSLEGIQQLFEGAEPSFRRCERTGLGFSTEVIPMEQRQLTEFRDALAASFATERRLVHIEGRFQEEVLAAHGGVRAVLTREPRFVAEMFESVLFQRVADAIGVWLEDRDAASLLKQRFGSNEGVADELVRCMRSPSLRIPEAVARRIVVCAPSSPSGRSLRECLVRTAFPPGAATFVTIREDVVVCVELDGLNLSSVANDLVAGQPWLADLAAKLVSRNDVLWADMSPAE